MKKNVIFVFAGIILSLLLISCPSPSNEVDETASYKVEHYQQNIEDDDYTIISADTQTIEATVGETTNAEAKTYDGFTAKSFEQKKIKADNSTVIKIYYNRKIIKYTFNASGGNWNGSTENKIIEGKFGAKVNPPENPVFNLHTFCGWNSEIPQTFGKEDAYFSAKWTEIKKVTYTVEHWIQTTDGNEYSKTDYIDIKENFPGEITEAESRNFLGFDVEVFNQQIVKEDGSTVVQIRYKRKTIVYTFIVDDLEWAKIDGLYESEVNDSIDNPSKEGYKFKGWSEAIPKYFGAQNKVFTAKWEIIPETLEGKELKYKVEHWLQNLDDDEYTKHEEEIKTGIYLNYTEAEEKKYPGFTASYFRQELIEKDTVIQIKYYRNRIYYKFNATEGCFDNNIKTIEIYGPYGATVEKPSDPVKEGYTFVWDKEIPETYGTEIFVEYKAIWTINKYNITFVTNYDIPLESQTVDYKNTLTKPQNLVRQNYSLKWYTDEAFTKPYDFDTPVTQSFTLYAKWQYEGKIVSDGITINGAFLEKTGEVEVINHTITVPAAIPDFIPEDTYQSYPNYMYVGSFAENNTLINPFIMSKYAVTQELYNAVMSQSEYAIESKPSFSKNNNEYPLIEGENQKYRPVEGITWYDAVYFCNKLTELTGGLTNAYTIVIPEDGISDGHIKKASVTCNDDATGYRLPTSVEWEFAARGGDPSKPEWNYLFAGSPSDQEKTLLKNSGIDSVGWYRYNTGNGGITGDAEVQQRKAGYGPHEVGLKKPNTLGLYDMSGNIYEWCNDYSIDSTDYCVIRGGCWQNYTRECSVCLIGDSYKTSTSYFIGFRLVRTVTIQNENE